MEEKVKQLIFTIEELKKRLARKEEELVTIQKNCQHSLPISFEIQLITDVEREGRFQFYQRAFRTCQKCGKRVYIE
jgi:hypothetical protein